MKFRPRITSISTDRSEPYGIDVIEIEFLADEDGLRIVEMPLGYTQGDSALVHLFFVVDGSTADVRFTNLMGGSESIGLEPISTDSYKKKTRQPVVLDTEEDTGGGHSLAAIKL